MLSRLPGWIVGDQASVRDEMADYRGTTPAERWRLAHSCSRDAMWAIRASGRAQRILETRAPLPASTVAALDRLRRASGWGDDDR